MKRLLHPLFFGQERILSVFVPHNWLDGDEQPLSEFERTAFASGLRHVAGVDEAGRGPLAGPIVAGAVMLGAPIEGVDDSKRLSEATRERLYDVIMSGNHRVGVCVIESTELDAMGLQPANYACMVRVAEQLLPIPELVLIDGFRVPGCRFNQKKIVKGDQLSQSIAAASIVAKVTRDRIMKTLDAEYPAYGFAQHKGYGTKAHLEAIHEYGPCPEHRRTFAPIAELLETSPLF